MSSQAYTTSLALNKLQNQDDFVLELLEEVPIIFRESLFSKTLDNPKDNPENINNYRSITIKCLYKNCT